MKKIISMLVAILLAFGTSTAYAVEYVSIADLRIETKDDWHQTYEAHGRTITVDVPIGIPDVTQVPVIEIAYPENLSIYDSRVKIHTQDGRSVNFSVGELGVYDTAVSGRSDYLYALGAVPENNPFTRQEAEDFAKSIPAQYGAQLGTDEYIISAFFATTRCYRFANDGYSQIDYDKPTTEMGCYELTLRQCFDGIPYLANYAPSYLPPKDQSKIDAPFGKCFIRIANQDYYGVNFEPAQKVGTVAEDIPLMPFAKCKSVLEGLIENGILRDVYAVDFGYVAQHNPDNLYQSFILLPAWRVRGDVYESAKSPDGKSTDEAKKHFRIAGGAEIIVMAQTGEYKDPLHNDPKRDFLGGVITWEEVK